MESIPPYWLALAGLALLVVGYQGVRRRRIMGSSGRNQGLRSPAYYLRTGAFWLSGILLLLMAAMAFQRQSGWGAMLIYILLLLLLGWVLFRFKNFRRVMSSLVRMPNLRRKGKQAAKTRGTEGKPVSLAETGPKQWALAAAALPGMMRGLDAQTLAGRSKNDSNTRKAQKWLRAEWDIDDEEEFEEVQDWLLETGHRTEFFEEIHRFKGFLPEQRRVYEQQLAAGELEAETVEEIAEMQGRLALVDREGLALTQRGFLAWDYLRYLDNCRAGYLAGYLSEADAWDTMLSAAQILQSRYDGWEEVGEAFLQAREYWSTIETERNGAAWRNLFLQLREDPNSPWNQVPWDLALYSR